MTAHAVQRRRLQPYNIRYNSQISENALEGVCRLGKEEKALRKDIFQQYQLSARGATKMMRVARTIADLDHSENVECKHMLEALSYRMTDIFQRGSGI